MSLRAAVLNAALPHVNRTGFTRSALVEAMRSLPSSTTVQNATETPVLDASPSASSTPPPSGLTSSSPEPASAPSEQGLSQTEAENALDVLFGPGLGPARALVEAWCQQGLAQMTPGGGSRRVDEVLFDPLSRRLWWSASAGSSLLDAHALLATNHTIGPSSIPMPPGAGALFQAVSNILPLPGSRAGPYGANNEVNTMTALNLGRIPSPPNPLAGVQYAWQIADRAVNVARPNRGKGVMREDRGFGTEWYTTRVGVMMAYLEAESHLLQPLPPLPTDSPASTADANPQLAPALSALRSNLRKMDEYSGIASGVEGAAGGVISLIEEFGRSVAGIIRSRGF